jgi:hypothetical protein
LAASAALSKQSSSGETRSKVGVNMTCSIRYYRPGTNEDAGLLIIGDERELPAYKARLEASGYTVIDAPVKRPFEAIPAKSR